MRRWIPALLAFAILAVACDDGLGPNRARVHVVVQPRFAQVAAETVDDDPALRVDNIRVVIVDEAGDTIADQIVEWPLDQDTLRIEVAIEVTGEQQFDFTLQGREGNTVLFQAQEQLDLSSDETNPEPSQPVLEYAGPEASMVSVTVQGPAQAFVAGDVVQLTASGTTDQDTEVTDPLMVWTSLDTLAATVDSVGLVQVKHDGSRTVRVVGRVAFRTLADTVALPVIPDTMIFVRYPDTIPALGWHYIVNGISLGADGDTVRNTEIDWTVRDENVVEQTPTYDIGVQGSMISRHNGSTWVVAALGPFVDSVLVVVDQVTAAAAPMPLRAVVGIGDTVRLSIISLDANGYPVENAPPPIWTSAQPGTAAVDSTGLVTGMSAPTVLAAARVTGEVEGASYNAWVEVRDGINVGRPTSLSIGDGHGCWIEDIRSYIYCQGDGSFGQLGTGMVVSPDTSVLAWNAALSPGESHTQVSAGGLHSCAVLTDGLGGSQPFCWGDNRFGQLGDGTLTTRLVPTAVDTSGMGVDLVQLATGGGHTCGLTAAGAAYCWGSNAFGQLGSGSAIPLAPTPIAVAGGHTFTELAAGWTHTCGLATDGTVWCWGRGDEGQIGDGALVPRGTPVQVSGGGTYTAIFVGAAHSCAITGAGGLECWGYNSSGQVGTGTTAFVVPTPTALTFPAAINVVDVGLGWIHGCALDDLGDVYCWGANDRLQLGQGSPLVSRTPMAVPLGFAPTGITAGGYESCATDADVMACWGGIPADYLGRNEVVSAPDAADPTGGAFSGR